MPPRRRRGPRAVSGPRTAPAAPGCTGVAPPDRSRPVAPAEARRTGAARRSPRGRSRRSRRSRSIAAVVFFVARPASPDRRDAHRGRQRPPARPLQRAPGRGGERRHASGEAVVRGARRLRAVVRSQATTSSRCRAALVAYSIDRKAAAFVYKRRLHVITLFVVPRRRAAMARGRRGGGAVARRCGPADDARVAFTRSSGGRATWDTRSSPTSTRAIFERSRSGSRRRAAASRRAVGTRFPAR